MSRLFGTDGVRGLANADLTGELAFALAVAGAQVLTERAETGARPLAVVGRDTRASGEFLEAAVVAGLASAGVDVLRLGVLPTPGVAQLTLEMGADLGVVLSASHNPMPDNGIKFFSRAGHKLDDTAEDAIEAGLGQVTRRPTGAGVGRVRDLDTAVSRYVDHLVATVPTSLAGYKVVVDCANGAAHAVAPLALEAAGAEVIAIHDTPDGLNINAGCGATHLDDVRTAVVRHGADAGFAHDGDADRCLAVDASGQLVDGDQLLALLAVAMRDEGTLRDDTVVTTVMANLGFTHAMRRERIRVRTTKVGDRYVLQDMLAHGCSLGGEQSGHFILLDHATTGDGVLTALHVLARVSGTGASLAELAAVMTRLPQVLVNVGNVDKARVDSDPAVATAVAAAVAELGESGRVLLRPSGTEPVVRVMVEAADPGQAQQIADRLAKVVESVAAC
ncbi:MAG TPA: phosphoglucosamine mutase [Nocardioidaceae bacterium]|jgi:phosphoglucosamine mutase|nr:phosphoglucosamine mutase [Nocardioidaceae bacterium]